MSFVDKVVMVTGASSGIGAATATLFCREGANVVMTGRNETKLKSVAEYCKRIGKEPIVVKADVSSNDDTKRIIDETIAAFGKINVLVNNAGFATSGSIEDGSIMKSYDEVMATNLRAIIQLTVLAAPYLINTKGNIVNISSVGGQCTPRAPFLSYSVSKACLDHFTRGAALELSSYGVRVNAISPGPVKTDAIPTEYEEGFKNATALNKLAEPEEIADLVLFLASDKAISVTGANYVADNGLTLKN